VVYGFLLISYQIPFSDLFRQTLEIWVIRGRWNGDIGTCEYD